ncbi:MAG: hypothetical protein ACRDCE_07220, partial [Cetobacterium sp.]|uniref:hypothetical protein n=1 Tax=Cetobacterium sp. TaxID=2071632 RepID=UPI003EE4EE90
MSEVSNKSIRHETGPIVKEVRLFQGTNGIDLTRVFNGIVINEDIEMGFLSGTLVFIDDFMTSKDALDGTEVLDITFSSRDGDYQEYEKPYKKRFRVTKYEQTLQSGLGTQRSMIMHFVSPASVVNDSIKLFRSYSNTSSSAFVNSCCDLMGVDE